MTANLDTGMTLAELLIALAESCNLSEFDEDTGEAVVPTDPETRRKLVAAVNEGLRTLSIANPKWRCLELVFGLTFSADGTGPFNIESSPERYALPHQIKSRPKGNWYYTDGTSGSVRVLDTSWERVRAAFATQPDASGIPEIACVRPYDPPSGPVRERRKFEVTFFPKPAGAYTVEAAFRVAVERLVNDTDRHPFGSDFDQGVLAHAEAAYHQRDDEDPAAADRAQAKADRLTLQLIELDRQQAPRTLGVVRDPSIRTTNDSPRARSYTGVTTYNGVSIADTPY